MITAVAASNSDTPVASIRLVFWERGIRRGKGDGITRTPFRGDSTLSLRVKLAVSARVKRGATEGSNPQDKSFQSDVWYQSERVAGKVPKANLAADRCEV